MAASTQKADVGAMKRTALRISLLAISSVFVFELVAGVWTNSLALLTDSSHALLDAVVTAILIVAATLALRPRDTDHTYGHGKIETIGGFIGGVALFVVAVFFIYEAVARMTILQSVVIVRPAAIGFAAIAYTLAADAFRIALLFRTAKRTGAPTIRADLYHAMADFASTGVALAGLWLVSTGFVQGDSIAAIILGAVLAFLSVRFVYQNATELTDVISPKIVARVHMAASETEGVLGCGDVKVRRVGRQVFVDVIVSLRAHLSFEQAHITSELVEANIARSMRDAGLNVSAGDINVHFEPTNKGITPESTVEMAAAAVDGVTGVHSVLVSKITGSELFEVSLHIQVRSNATISEAHSLADAVEDSIRKHLVKVEDVTVHLEPHMPDLGGVQPVSNEVGQSIKEIIMAANDVERVGKIVAYRTDQGILKIDLGCVFKNSSKGEMTIEQIHDRVSELEKQIRVRHPGSIVTIHAEPG